MKVLAYSGYRGEQEPRALVTGRRRLEVTAIDERWREPEASYFRVRTEDGGRHLLRFDREKLDWTRVRDLSARSGSGESVDAGRHVGRPLRIVPDKA